MKKLLILSILTLSLPILTSCDSVVNLSKEEVQEIVDSFKYEGVNKLSYYSKVVNTGDVEYLNSDGTIDTNLSMDNQQSVVEVQHFVDNSEDKYLFTSESSIASVDDKVVLTNCNWSCEQVLRNVNDYEITNLSLTADELGRINKNKTTVTTDYVSSVNDTCEYYLNLILSSSTYDAFEKLYVNDETIYKKDGENLIVETHIGKEELQEAYSESLGEDFTILVNDANINAVAKINNNGYIYDFSVKGSYDMSMKLFGYTIRQIIDMDSYITANYNESFEHKDRVNDFENSVANQVNESK